MRAILFLCALFAFSMSANAGVEDRATEVRAQVQDNNNYHAHLAREFTSAAEDELGQHDITAARSFMEMAEEQAGQAGGEK